MGLALASGWSILELVALALSDMGEASSSFSQKPPLQPPSYQSLATQTQYVIVNYLARKCSPSLKKKKVMGYRGQ